MELIKTIRKTYLQASPVSISRFWRIRSPISFCRKASSQLVIPIFCFLCALVRLVRRRDNCCFLKLVTKFWMFLEGLAPGRVRIEKYLNNFIRSSIKISKEHMFVDCIFYLSFTKANFTPITIWFQSHQRS